jgi:flagellar biogenesis protein FliO
MSVSEILRLSVSLIVLVGGLLVVRRWSRNGGRPTRRLAGSARTSIRITGRAGITRHSTVAVVEVDGQRFLVGAGEHGVNLLAELPPTVDGVEPGSTTPVTADTLDLSDPDALTDPSAPIPPRMGLVARLQRSTLRTADVSRPRADPR